VTPTPTQGSRPADHVDEPDGGRRPDPVLAAAVDLARAAAETEAGEDGVGRHVGVDAEDSAAATHLFETLHPGYRGWRWAVTVATAGPGTPVTVSEVVLLPGPDALVAPEWVPWQERVRAGDLGPGDLLPARPEDPRLTPGYLDSDDAAMLEVAGEIGLGRGRLLSRAGRLETAERWHRGEFGPDSDMARSAPEPCGSCGFYLPLPGSLRAAFGVCANEMSPADGHVVHVEYGCGAHSEVQVDVASPVPVADLVYDDAELDVESTAEASTVDTEGAEDSTAEKR
jgi:hypothetical protein